MDCIIASSILVSLISTIDLHILSWQANRLKFLSFSFLNEYLKKIVFARRMNSEAAMRRKVFSEAATFNLLLPILPERKVQKVIMSRQASYLRKSNGSKWDCHLGWLKNYQMAKTKIKLTTITSSHTRRLKKPKESENKSLWFDKKRDVIKWFISGDTLNRFSDVT